MDFRHHMDSLFEQIKGYVWDTLNEFITVDFGEITNVDPDTHEVRVLRMRDLLPTPYLPLMVPFYGLRSLPKIGDQAVILYVMNTPQAVIGFTYNVQDVVEANVGPNQVRLTKGGLDVLFDGESTDKIIVNGSTTNVARVGDTVTITVAGTVYTGTITSGSAAIKA